MYKGERIPLDPFLRCEDAVEFEEELRRRIVGQEEGISKTTEVIQKYMAGFNDPTRPVGTILLLGPTGTGKTRLVEATCHALFGDPKGMVKVDCAEFQHSHDVYKITGAPPGYVGHKEDGSQITQDKLNKTWNEKVKLSVLLFDEIEKAHESFWDLLLGILDKGRLTDNVGKAIDLTRTIIFMTSNVGAREVIDELDGDIGFSSDITIVTADRMKVISEKAASKKFKPEFMNRLDQIITFQYLTEDSLRSILDIELRYIQERILKSSQIPRFAFSCTDEVKNYLLSVGTNSKYGARYLKRTLEKHLVMPLSNLTLTGQIGFGDLIEVDYTNRLTFHKVPLRLVEENEDEQWKDYRKASDE